MATVDITVGREKRPNGNYRHYVNFPTKSLVIRKMQEIHFKSKWNPNSIFKEIRLAGFELLKLDSTGATPKYDHDGNAKKNWKDKRGTARFLTPAQPDDWFPARDDDQVNDTTPRLVKFSVTMVLEDGTEITVDPILDERPGG